MENKEGKMIVWAVMAMLIFALLTIAQADQQENEVALQQSELPIKEMNTAADRENVGENSSIEMNEPIRVDMETQKDIMEELIQQEASINLEKIDLTILEKLKYDVAKGKEIIADFTRNDKIIMDTGNNYSTVKGVTCFRGNHYRDSASFGFAEINERKLEIQWQIPIGGIDSWTGVGWNGQPSIVEWSKELKNTMNIIEEKKAKEDLREVIYAALDGKVYFLDLEDGTPTREKIQIPGPVKGSLTVDPRGIPLLYVGQGINTVQGKRVEMGYRIYSLIDQQKLFFINGSDSFAFRSWAAFDSTALIDEKTDTMLLAGENGIFYTVKLNTDYDKIANTITIDPEVMKYRYRITGNNYQGIENSVAVYKNLAYFADNGGWLQCIDLNTLTPIWVRDITDDTDSTVVIEEEKEDQVNLYTACEVDKQGAKGISYIRKIDALTGQLSWEKAYACDSKLGDKPNNGGALATPVVGKNSLNHMVIYNLARWGGFNRGLLVALDKNTGEEVWRLELANYSWSSPVDVYTEEGEGYIVVCDSAGKMHLVDGLTGHTLDVIELGANVEGSPAVFDNMVVVGTRGQKIYGVRIY
ncbi:MAG: pyrrolo-quinoline quinone [Anaerosolibacter sp.]|uniref:outer membrane protein assembly factor BamB family protein n=1 Tax=Anaerosolibacter sp. TaxID=1872527 RepID=UPI0026033570|nr:PQQ-binding-like beta-propeller repeat protein [Anaerosolibacter sp.]MDF2546790.1 pyrrolo-quinoline quinone [Anaerosolibacter sp.]